MVSEHEELAAQTAVSAVLTSDAEGVVAVALVVGANAPVAVMRADVQLLREVSLSKEVRNVWRPDLTVRYCSAFGLGTRHGSQ